MRSRLRFPGPIVERVAVFVAALVPLCAWAAGDPWIGVQLGPGTRGGVAVVQVMEGSPGEAAHLAAGDELLAIDGRKVAAAPEVVAAVRAAQVGHTLHLTVASAPGQRSVEVKLTARPDDREYQRSTLLRRAAPELGGTLQSGEKVGPGGPGGAIASLKGQVVLLDFFATWCGPCVDALPHLEQLHETLGRKGLRVIGISGEEPPVVAGAAGKYHLKYSLLSDAGETIAARYHVFALPTMVVIDRKGQVHEIAIADVDAADRAVRELLGGR